MSIDSGGSIAIKGFNYQKAVIAYIAVLNYQRDGFQIIVENEDDVEVFIEENKIFIQIKSENLSLYKISKQDGKSNRSILGKLFDKIHENALYKIVTTNKFSATDKKSLERARGYLLPCEVFKYSSEQIAILSKTLLVENCPIDESKSKIDKCYIVMTPFEANLEAAIPFLLGVMSDNDISIDGNRGRVALNELFTQIDSKSELDPKKYQFSLCKKQFIKSDLDKIFIRVDKEGFRNDLWKELIEECKFQRGLKYNILKDLFSIYTIHRNLKIKIALELGNFDLNAGREAGQIKELYERVSNNVDEKSAIYAVLIDLMVDKILENGSGC